ncbi:DUF3387 domain-containing protein [Moraxellaceae bacterium AER2_44_116]|nr:DUF3387 domain-containing protein [Moraxellaceae bacterium]TQC99988.1 DUF3387 domain-containing protein [Moraxellaceae bacterium AER2_44_116]
MIKRILRKYKYPPDQQEEVINLVLQHAESLSAVGRRIMIGHMLINILFGN